MAVMGPNGCGKTTLLHCLLGLVRPQSGTVRVGGVEVTGRQVSQMARHVGMVFQNADHQLVADTVRDEAMFACRRLAAVDDEQGFACAELLDRAGLGARRADHPFRLSWGQKRRLNVISAVLHGPRLLLLDEPLAGQDWASATFLLEVISAIVDARSGGACLLVTHDAQVVRDVATRVLFLAGGRVLVDAPVTPAFVRLRELGYGAYAADGSNAPIDA
jgi:energy-coupling factor transport system ATP-binding protein